MRGILRRNTVWTLLVLAMLGGLLISSLSQVEEEALATDEKAAETAKADGRAEKKSEGEQAAAPESAKPPAKDGAKEGDKEISALLKRPRGACLTDETAIEDMKKVREELVAKQKELEKRETELAAKEQALQDQLKQIESVRDEIKQAQSLGSAADETKIAKLVETFEGMSPKAAAAVLAGVDEGLATQALMRLSSPKTGKILAAMDSAKAAKITELLAGVARAKKTTPTRDVAEATNLKKGGTNNDGNGTNRKPAESRPEPSREPQPAVGR